MTIPADIRARAGLLPNTEVAFEYDGNVVRIVRAEPKSGSKPTRSELLVAHLRGRGEGTMTTDEMMELLRGE